MSWCFEDEISSYADAVLDCLERLTALVPSIWPLEIGNVLCVAERKKRISKADGDQLIGLLSELPIIVVPEPPERMFREILTLARKCNLSTYDAAYLDLAMKRKIPIATLDEKLLGAAAKCRVPNFEP